MGSYPVDTETSSEASYWSVDYGNIAAATEYNSDATKIVDRATDSGFEGGVCGGETSVIGILEDTVCYLILYIGCPSVLASGTV